MTPIGILNRYFEILRFFHGIYRFALRFCINYCHFTLRVTLRGTPALKNQLLVKLQQIFNHKADFRS